jgi:hypothetical protein
VANFDWMIKRAALILEYKKVTENSDKQEENGSVTTKNKPMFLTV